ncbi:hypothetical protein KBB68_03300 [Candidatus Babeliales bacterium]|nr:hypothetical protein [Candidatus Babeliales bacterium]
MFIKKNIILFSFLFVSCAQNLICSGQNLPKSGSGQNKFEIISKTVQVYCLPTKTWVRETQRFYSNGNSYEDWEYFPTKEEAELGRLNKAQQAKALPAHNEETDSVVIAQEEDDDFPAFGPIEQTLKKKPMSSAIVPVGAPLFVSQPRSSQPVQPFQVQKIHLSDEKIRPVAESIYDKLVLQFTGSMTTEEVAALMKKNNFENYDDVTFQKIARMISTVLKNLDYLAEEIYEKLQSYENFQFERTHTKEEQERYLKNYLGKMNQGQYISNNLQEKILARFAKPLTEFDIQEISKPILNSWKLYEPNSNLREYISNFLGKYTTAHTTNPLVIDQCLNAAESMLQREYLQESKNPSIKKDRNAWKNESIVNNCLNNPEYNRRLKAPTKVESISDYRNRIQKLVNEHNPLLNDSTRQAIVSKLVELEMNNRERFERFFVESTLDKIQNNSIVKEGSISVDDFLNSLTIGKNQMIEQLVDPDLVFFKVKQILNQNAIEKKQNEFSARQKQLREQTKNELEGAMLERQKALNKQ